MGQKIVIGPINKGMRNDVTPFNIDNDSFPVLRNAYQWRGRIKRKRGTEPFTRLARQIYGPSVSANPYYMPLGNTSGTGSASDSLFTIFSIPIYVSIVPFSISIKVGAQTFTDNGLGILSNGSGGTGAINYATGLLTFQTNPVLIATAIFIIFSYYPSLPVMGLEPFVQDASIFPQELGFDTQKSYNISLAIGTQNISYAPYASWDVTYYNNPGVKPNSTAFSWNLQNYQQIWTTNYSGALWAVPGIQSPFNNAIVGMQFSPVTLVAAPTPTTVVITVTGINLVAGDYVFLNEFDPAIITGINFQTGVITAGTAPGAITISIPTATMAGAGGATTKGIVQYLTNTAFPTQDTIRWYNGPPVNGQIPPTFTPSQGWVNFSPPLLNGPDDFFSISDLPTGQYYLVGARMAVPFKDRLIFFGAIVQKSSGNPIYLPDTIIYSQNGTPYYTASFPGVPSPTTIYTPQLVPTNQTAQPSAWWENVTGYGGFLSAGYSRPITTVSINEDALIVGFSDRQTRLLYTGNDIVPFNFFVINSELGSDSTFSTITLDRGVMSMGGRGFVLTSQIQSQRIDLEIPDEIFRIDLKNKGSFRACAARDFQNEWVYFTYTYANATNVFPNTTFLYNYRDNSWAQFYESYTTYGLVRPLTGYIWTTLPYQSWNEWSNPWLDDSTNEQNPLVCAGNAQGFVVFKGESTGESPSAYIESISGNTITSTNNCFATNDFILITGVLGTIGQQINGKIFQIESVTNNTFTLIGNAISGTYLGNGLISRLYKPFIQSKQFPVAWEMARKTRLGPQQYLLSYTDEAQITLLIYLSQSSSTAWNDSTIVPDPTTINSALVYSTTLYTCPESTNLGLTPANINLQMLTATQQEQIWHRMNTSLIGDTVQIGFTISDEQMGMYIPSLTSFAISNITNAYPAVVTTTGQFAVDTLVKLDDVLGMTEINFLQEEFNYYQVINSTPSGSNFLVSLNIDSTTFGAFTTSPDATILQVSAPNATEEVELHSMVLDVQPSQLLA